MLLHKSFFHPDLVGVQCGVPIRLLLLQLRRESRLRLLLRLELVVANGRLDGGGRGNAADDLLRLEGAGAGVLLTVELTADVEVTYN